MPRSVVFALGKLSEYPLGALGVQSPVALYRLRSALARVEFESRGPRSCSAGAREVGVREGIRRSPTSLRGVRPPLLADRITASHRSAPKRAPGRVQHRGRPGSSPRSAPLDAGGHGPGVARRDEQAGVLVDDLEERIEVEGQRRARLG